MPNSNANWIFFLKMVFNVQNQGSQKQDLFSGLKIDSCKVIFPQSKNLTQSTILLNKKEKLSNQKTNKNIYLIFQLRSKSYNAYAGQVQLNISTQSKSKYHQKIQNCVDSQASISYQIFRQKKQKNKSGEHSILNVDEEKPKINIKSPTQGLTQNLLFNNERSPRNTLLKKKTVTSVENAKYRVNFKSNQKSFLIDSNTFSPKGTNSPMYNSVVSIDKSDTMENVRIYQEQQHSQISSKKSKIIEKISASQINQKNKLSLLKSNCFSPDITKRLIQLQKKLDQEKQKSIKGQLQLQAKRNQIKQLIKLNKTLQKKFQTIEIQLKKVKKLQTNFVKQNQHLKDLNESLKHKLNQKNQHLNLLNKRSSSKETSFKEQLKNLYQKLEIVSKQKQFKNLQKQNLQNQLEKQQKKIQQQTQHQVEFFTIQKQKSDKMIKKLQKQLSCVKQFFVKTSKNLACQIDHLLKYQKKNINKKNEKNAKNEKKEMLQSGSFQSSTTSYSFQPTFESQLNRQYFSNFSQIVLKVQRISNEFYDSLQQKNDFIKRNQKQIYQLKTQLRSLYLELQNMKEANLKQKQKNRKELQKFEQILEQEKKAHISKLNQLKNQIKDLQQENNELNDGILSRNRQMSSLKILKNQLEQNIQKMSEQMVQRAQQHKNNIDKIMKEKQQLIFQYKQNTFKLQGQLQKQRVKSNQFKQLSINQKTQINSLENEIKLSKQKIQSDQKQLKLSQQNTAMMNKQVSELRNMINQITGISSKKQKEFNSQNKQLSHQVNSFKQNYKALQQAKNNIQQQLQKMQAEITRLKNENFKMEEDYKKIQKIFNTNQKSSQNLRNSIFDMKKQNDQLKIKLKKKQQFEQQLEDQFQCSFYQIRQKLDFFINQNREIQKQKNNVDRQNSLKIKRLTAMIDCFNTQLNMINKYLSVTELQTNKISQTVQQFKKLLSEFEKQNSSSYVKQFKQKISQIDKIYGEVMNNYIMLQQQLEQPRKTRSKNSITIRRGSVTENMSQSLMRKASTSVNLTSINTMDPSPTVGSPRNLIKKNSMINSYEALSKKKDQIRNQRAYTKQQMQKSLNLEQSNARERSTTEQPGIIETKVTSEQKELNNISGLGLSQRLSKKPRPLIIDTKMQKIQQKPQNFTPTLQIDPRKKALKRLNTMK